MPFVESHQARISYTVDGQLGGPPLLLIMGLGGSSAEWGSDFLEQLARHFQVACMDNRGVGESTTATYDFTLQDMVEDAIAVLDDLAWPRAHVLGLSMGGMIAQQMAISAPGRVAGLVLMSTHFGGSEVVPLTERGKGLFAGLIAGETMEQYFARRFTTLAAPGFAERNPAVVTRFVSGRGTRQVTPELFQAQLTAVHGSDRSRMVARISQPTLVLHGDEDCLIPVDNGRNLAARIPGAQLSVLEDCGHLPPWEHPAECAARLVPFLEAVRA